MWVFGFCHNGFGKFLVNSEIQTGDFSLRISPQWITYPFIII